MKQSARTIAQAGHGHDHGHGAGGPGSEVEAALGANDPELRRTALGAAHRLGRLDADRLRPFLADPDHRVRVRAAELAPRLQAREPGSPAGVGAEAEAGVGAEAEAGVGAEADQKLVEAVATLLDDEATAEVAAFSLGELGGTTGLAGLGPAGPGVEAALADQARSHPDPLCRESAVAALGALGAGREAVLAATGDIAAVRRRAVIALATFDGDDIDAALARATHDRDWQVRQIAEDLLPYPPSNQGRNQPSS